MAEIPTTEPSQIRAGDTITWKKTFTDYPATEYTLAYRFISGTNTIDVTAAASDTDHLVSISAATSAAYVAGDYTWFSFVTDIATGLIRYTLARGTTTVLPNIATATEFRSHAKKVLDAIEAVIEGRASRSDSEYSIGGRTLRNMTHDELIKMRSFYQQEYSRERAAELIAQGLASGTRILTRFK